MVKRIFLDQPLKNIELGLWELELVGRPTTDYNPRQAAEQLYDYLDIAVPHETVDEFLKLLKEKPLE
ncbi:MAG: hypothetical protein AAB866_01975 [Patescibacteria group bacterium]